MTDTPTLRLVLLHGFTQTGRSWLPLIEKLLPTSGADLEIDTPDLPGHGESAGLRCDLWATAGLLARQHGRGIWIGYSLGGRVALHVALARPEVVSGLVVIGATGGIDDPAERAARREADEHLAGRIEQLGVRAFLDEWLAQPLFASLTARAAQLDDRLRNTAAGLAGSLRSCGTGSQEPLWRRLAALGHAGLPVLVMAGEHDQKFRSLAERLASSIGSTAQLEVVPGAGHAAHLEQPGWVAGCISTWLGSTHP